MDVRFQHRQAEIAINEKRTEKDYLARLAEKAKYGDREALSSLCKTIARNVLFRTSCKMNKLDAEDAAQNVLLAVCTKIHSLKEPKAFGAWLNSIIMNEIKDHYSDNAKKAEFENIDDYSESIVESNDDLLPAEFVIKEEDRKAVMDIIKQLPDRQYEAVLLHYYEGMTITETAEMMGVERQSVNRYLVIAREKIKTGLQTQAKSSNSLYSLSLLPIGGLLTRVLSDEAALIGPVSEEWLSNTITDSEPKVSGTKMVTGAAILAFIARTLPTAIICLVAALGISVGIMKINNTFVPQGQAPAIISQNATGTVIFSGGDSERDHINPTQAIPQIDSDNGEVKIHSWRISKVGRYAALYEGKGSDANGALTELSQNGEEGDYELVYSMEDEIGDRYTLRRTFFVRR